MKKTTIVFTIILLLMLFVSCKPETPQKVNIILDADNGTNAITLIGDIGATATLPMPTKVGFAFLGWFDSTGTKYVDSASFLETTLNLKARWNQTLSIKGSIALPADTALGYSDFWIKLSDGTVFQVSDDGSFEILGLKTNKEYDIYFSSTMPSGAVLTSKSLIQVTSYGALKPNIITSIDATIDLGVVPMRPTSSIEGKVTLQELSDGNYSGINVSIPETWFTTTTDVNGNYNLSDLPEGVYTLKFSKEGFTSKVVENIILANENHTSSTLKTLDDVQLSKYIGNINGFVKVEGLSDYSGVTVTIPGTIYTTTTNTAGEYTFEVTPGTYSSGLQFRLADYATETINSSITVEDSNLITIDTVEMKAINATVVSGTVKVKAIDDCSGINITLSKGIDSYTAVTDEAGKWILNHIPLGTYSMKISKLNIPELTSTIDIKAGINDLGTYNLVPDGASVIGYVYLDDKDSSEGISISLKDKTSDDTISFTTLADGYYIFTNIDTSSEYSLSFKKDGWVEQSTDLDSLLTYEIREIEDITLIDDIDPIFESFMINGGQNTTEIREATLSAKANDNGSGFDYMLLSYDESFSSYFYKGDLSQNLEIELPIGNGIKSIYARVYDKAGNYSQKSATIKVTSSKYEISGILVGDNLHWTAENSPYIVTDNIVVPAGSTLIIDPGVDVQFNGAYYIQVEGTITAVGTEEAPISFYNSPTNLNKKWVGIIGSSYNLITEGSLYNRKYVSGNILKYVILTDGSPCAKGYLWIEKAEISSNDKSLGTYNSARFDSKNNLSSYSYDTSNAFKGYLVDSEVSGIMTLYGANLIRNTINARCLLGENNTIVSSKIENATLSVDYVTLINNFIKNSTMWKSRGDGYEIADYNTFEECALNIGVWWNSHRPEPLQHNHFINSSFYANLDDSDRWYSISNSNFEGDIFISTQYGVRNQQSIVSFDHNYWGDKTEELKSSSASTTNLSFIYDYFDDFSLPKVNCDNWIEKPWPHVGYNPNRMNYITSIHQGYSHIEVSDDRSVSGYIEIEIETNSSLDNMVFRYTENIEDFISTDNDDKYWDYGTKTIKYVFNFDEMKDLTFFIQGKDENGIITPIYTFEVSGDIETGTDMTVIGPAGSYIYYANPNYETDGWRYLEATPNYALYNSTTDKVYAGTEEERSGLHDFWFGFGYLRNENNENCYVNGLTITDETCTKSEIGTGKENTEKLVKAMGESTYTSKDLTSTYKTNLYAANIADGLECNGFDDWFLPSKDEMVLIYNTDRIRGMSLTGTYWTSTESSVENSFSASVSATSLSRNQQLYIRPARRF